MKNHFIVSALILINLSLIVSLHAQEFAYVTDSLQLRVYVSADASSEVLQTIDSGDSIEVFATENGFSKVTTYDGTEGWVKSAFLVEEPPAKLLYYSVGEKNKELEAEIETLKNNLQNATEASSESTQVNTNEKDANLINELKAQLEQHQQSNQALQNQLDENNANITTQTERSTNASPAVSLDKAKNMKWLYTGSAVFLLLGLLLGVKISTWRMRKRLHGFSI